MSVTGSSPVTSSTVYTKEIIVAGTNLGYQYFIDYKHPLATGNSGRVLLHRHLASLKLGRWLTSDEIVHHIDENKLNNEHANLEVMTRAEHTTLHNTKVILKTLVCPICNKEFKQNQSDVKYCSQICFAKTTIKSTITKEELDKLIPKHNWSSLGRLLGYSSNGIKKRAAVLGCDVTLINSAKI